MTPEIKLEETLVTLAFTQQRCFALRAEVEKLRQEIEGYKIAQKQEVADNGDSRD